MTEASQLWIRHQTNILWPAMVSRLRASQQLEETMVHLITVRPGETGWAVNADGFENDMLFFSGEKAEAAARSLARHVADAGQAAAIEIWLRDGRLAGRFICPPHGVGADGDRRPI